jgi:hypothetical protein
MASVRLVGLCALVALPGLAQVQITVNGVPYTSAPGMSGGPYPHFQLRADPPSPRANVVAGYLPVARSPNQPFGIGHRYFYDEDAHTYFGYDVVIQPDQQADTYRVTFYDLGIGPLDFSGLSSDALDPTIWKKQALPAMPAPKVIKVSDTLDTGVFVDPATGQKLIDSMSIVQMPQRISLSAAVQQMQFPFRNAQLPARGAVPTVSGTAREFSVDDAEMRIQQARVIINGTPQDFGGPTRMASGSLVWFYLPHHGRYILSLSPRAELGFVKAGEVRGGRITFTVGNDRVQLESPATIAPGDAPYVLYVLHDAEWAPTALGQSESLLLGSVSAGELAALTRK